VWLFTFVVFANALLLFLVQPMFARLVLPLLGGSPSVWTTCMLFFQSTLLAGYLYVHVSIRLLGERRQAILHAALVCLPALALPIHLSASGSAPGNGAPILWLLTTMATSVGLPFFVVATSAPLLQRWYASSSRGGRDPYFLYAASNAGSFAALILYPTVVEPNLSLRTQGLLWTGAYAVAATLTVVCAATLFRKIVPGSNVALQSSTSNDLIRGSRRLGWLALSCVPSSLMLAVTTHLSTDVAAAPLLWIVPLGIYLLTFVIAFSRRGVGAVALSARVLPLTLLPLVIFMITDARPPLNVMLPLHLVTFAALTMQCHGRLAADRPAPYQLTEYYLWIAAGGALGGLFNTLVAPRVFVTVAEYPMAIVAGCFLIASREQFRAVLRAPRGLIGPVVAGVIAVAALSIVPRLHLDIRAVLSMLAVAAAICFSVSRDHARFAIGVGSLFGAVVISVLTASPASARWLYSERTFFGVYRLQLDPTDRFLSMSHGTTVHGRQLFGALHPEPLTYYYRGSPIGNLFAARATAKPMSVGVIGLGVGSLAAYARPGDRWRFYEIDPAVETIARDTRFFHFLDACGGTCTVVVGDARLSLQSETARHDILVFDAFSSDAIPMHLLTREAVEIYLSRLAPGGVLAFHISNRHIDLRPVMARLGREYSLSTVMRTDAISPNNREGRASSEWVVMARHRADLGSLLVDPKWVPLVADAEPVWSDDFSNLWTVIRWQSQK
jgi:hypothetical protein